MQGLYSVFSKSPYLHQRRHVQRQISYTVFLFIINSMQDIRRTDCILEFGHAFLRVGVPTRPPRGRPTAFIPCTCHMYIHSVLSRYWVCSQAPAPPTVPALICASCAVRSELCLHPPSDSASRRTPLVLISDSHD